MVMPTHNHGHWLDIILLKNPYQVQDFTYYAWCRFGTMPGWLLPCFRKTGSMRVGTAIHSIWGHRGWGVAHQVDKDNITFVYTTTWVTPQWVAPLFLSVSYTQKMPGRRQRSVRPVTAARKLPPCPGPKLHAFKYRNAPIEWFERLDENRTNHSGIEASVFRVRIKSQDYALKVVSRTL